MEINLPQETRPIPGFEDYAITRDGHVKRVVTKPGAPAAFLKPHQRGNETPAYVLVKNGKKIRIRRDVLLSMAFGLPMPTTKRGGNHGGKGRALSKTKVKKVLYSWDGWE